MSLNQANLTALSEIDLSDGPKAKALELDSGKKVIAILLPVEMDNPPVSSTGKTRLCATYGARATAWDRTVKVQANITMPLAPESL
jgi:hypothetical protein